MCRFVAFKGKERIVLKKLLNDSSNSLIFQSHSAKETKTGLNADGFGMGWYDQDIDGEPGVFKSIQPAWNDENLINISSKLRSDCFISHVRASTVGDVSIANCHPFVYKQFLFAHNGTIQHFNEIKKDLLLLLDQKYFSKIKGQTDSEHFFFLLCSIIENELNVVSAQSLAKAISYGINQINQLLEMHQFKNGYKMNAVLTDGKAMVAIRYSSDINKQPLSLYYSKSDSIIIASECLTNTANEWKQIPNNTILIVDEKLNVTLDHISQYERK
ncbi:class II glutamine amidotransferase [Chlamydiales bacterium]|nr:class II glutamine amidotransferase [Chlamydiales bacterium]